MFQTFTTNIIMLWINFYKLSHFLQPQVVDYSRKAQLCMNEKSITQSLYGLTLSTRDIYYFGL